jgi:DNA mismatch endonuclease (patch repair protein)
VEENHKTYGLDRLRETLQVSESTAKAMRSNRAQETKPEIRLRKALWAAGLRGYRKNVRRLPGKPDVVFGKAKVCLFVHGCFWHGCRKCSRNLSPKKNATYWQTKIAGNRERDKRNEQALIADGWLVMTIWECELEEGLDQFVELVWETLQSRQ